METAEFDALAAAAGGLLKAKGEQLVAAESCTGGLVAGAVTAVSGSSEWFDRGFVTYSNEAKRDMLGVPMALIEEHGAVSEPVARAMALGALSASLGTLSVAITGIAGPGGGSPKKPVGTVCFAWARSGEAMPRSETRRFAGGRDEVRRQAVLRALQGVVDLLDDGGAGRA
ncbi:MAG: CinA family protein [Betaproteobacteria bacterium]|jgi:nicotinamide-nucleotide amidase|nr:CinA family protein [Betaproteobacteria bacterium]